MSQLQVTGEAKIRDIQGPVVANDGVITALDGAASQYVRGDGTLADFPTSSGGGSSVSYYLNSSVSQGTIGGVAYRELSKEPIIGAGTDIAISANGYVASYLTDANDPDVLSIPGGNFNCEFYFSVNNNTGNPFFYAELYKYDGTTFTLLGSSVGVPEYINQGTIIAPYYFAIPVPTSALALTDRLAIRIYVNVDGRTVTLHTENGHLCQVVTTLSKGMVSLNNLTDQSQFLTTGTSGTNFAIVSSGDTHTFNLPVASATNTGKLSSTDWSTFNNKQAALSFTAPLDNTSNTISIPAASASVDGYLDNLDWVKFNTAYNDSIISAAVTGTTTKTLTLNQQDGGTITAFWTDDNTDAVTSVFGRTGSVVAVSGDYNTDLVTEGTTNLYFTNARSRAALSFTAGSGAYNSTTGVITIPTNTNQLTNGASFITLTSLSAGTGISYNNTTGVITNSAPDQTVSLTAGAGISISGTYPSFTIASTITQYTDALARAALSFVAGSGAYNSTTGVITIPTNNNQITNGAGYITSSALSSYLPLAGGILTGALTLNYATPTIFLNDSGDAGIEVGIRVNNDDFEIYEPEDSNKIWLKINDTAEDAFLFGSKMWTAGNDGTGSGLDADLLDGNHASAFQLALTNPVTGTGTNNYIPKFTSTGSAIGDSVLRNDGIYVSLNGATNSNGMLTIYNVGAFSTQYINTGTGGATWQIGATNNDYGAGGGKFVFTYDSNSTLSLLTLIQSSRNVSIGSTADVSRLYVEGAHTSGRGIITANSSDTAYLHLTSSSATIMDVGVRFAKDNVEKWVIGMTNGSTPTNYTFSLSGSGLANKVFTTNIETGVTTYNYPINGTSATLSSTITANDMVTCAYLDISTGENRGFRLFNSGDTDGTWNITAGRTGVNNSDFTIRNAVTNVNALFISSAGAATFSGNVNVLNSASDADLKVETTLANAGARLRLKTSTTEWYIYTNQTSSTLKFFNGDDRFVLTNTGAATFSSSVTATSFIKTGGTSSQFLMADGSVSTGGGGSSQWITSGSNIYYTNNVSVGSANTSSKLSVYQSSPSTTTIDSGIVIGNGNGTTGVMAAIRFGTYGDEAGSMAYAKQFIAGIRDANGAGFGDLILGNYQGDYANGTAVCGVTDTAIRIKKSGNVIIGAHNTTDIQPTFANVRLQVNGSSYISNTASDCGQFINAGGGGWSFIQYSNASTNKFIQGYRDADALYHITAGATLATNAGFNMNSSSRVNFGGSSFNGIVSIQGSHVGGFGMLNMESTDNCIISLNSGGSYDVRIRYKYQGADQWFTGMLDNTTYKWTNSGGSVSLSLTQAGALTAAGGFFDTSDSRLKILVKDYEQPKGIENVAARMYVKNSRKELGYYAQDLQEILPSAVNEGEDGFLTLSYSQVHTAKIAYLEKEVAELKKLIKSLL